MQHQGQHAIDVGQVAVPVFICLLGAVLFVSFQAQPAQNRQAALQAMGLLRTRIAQTQRLMVRTTAGQAELEQRLALAESLADRSRLDRDLAQARQALADLTNKVSQTQILQARLDETRRQTETAEAETAEARTRLERLAADSNASGTNHYAGLFGAYRGALVVIDCDRDGATVFPGARRIDLARASDEIAALMPEIAKAGFVAVTARPGAFERSFGRFKKLVFEKVSDLNRGRSKPIGRCSFPLDANADLAALIPKGGAQ